MNLKSMSHVLSVIRRCDVILKNGQEQFVGLYYDSSFDMPIVLFKCDWHFNYYLSKITELIGVPCIDNRVLARALFEKIDEGDYIENAFMHSVATIYSKLPKYKESKEVFDRELGADIISQVYWLEEKTYKREEKKFFQKNKKFCNKQLTEKIAAEMVQKKVAQIAEKNKLDYRIIHNVEKAIYEFYLETKLEDYKLDFWQMLIISEPEKKVYVGNRSVFHCFEVNETEVAIEYFELLADILSKTIKKDARKYCEEFHINQRLYDIGNSSIKSLLEMNYNWKGTEYGFDDKEKTIFIIYLRSEKEPEKMFEICGTYAEFMRNPDAVKKLIESPKAYNKWNLWCRKRKYKNEKFDEKFQK